jgi:hypothetical protein
MYFIQIDLRGYVCFQVTEDWLRGGTHRLIRARQNIGPKEIVGSQAQRVAHNKEYGRCRIVLKYIVVCVDSVIVAME